MGALYNTHQCEARLYRPRVVVVDWEHMEGRKGGGWWELGGEENMVRRTLRGYPGVNRTGRMVGCFSWGWSYAGTEGMDIGCGRGEDCWRGWAHSEVFTTGSWAVLRNQWGVGEAGGTVDGREARRDRLGVDVVVWAPMGGWKDGGWWGWRGAENFSWLNLLEDRVADRA